MRCVCVLFCRFPFDWKNPRGFLLTAVIINVLAQLAIRYAAIIIAYGVGTNLCIVAVTEDVKQHLCTINDGIKMGSVDHAKTHRQISEYVELHSDSKQLRKR